MPPVVDLLAAADQPLSSYGTAGAFVAVLGAVGSIVVVLLRDARRNTLGAWTMAKERQDDIERVRLEADERVTSTQAQCDRRVEEMKVYYEGRMRDRDKRIEDLIVERDYWRREAMPAPPPGEQT